MNGPADRDRAGRRAGQPTSRRRRLRRHAGQRSAPTRTEPAAAPIWQAIAAIAERIEAARSMAVLTRFPRSRGSSSKIACVADREARLPFAAMSMDKGVLSDHTRSSLELRRAASPPAVREAVEGADLVIDAVASVFNEINTAAYSSHLDAGRLMTIGVDHIRIGDQVYNPVRMGDVFDGLAGAVRKNFGYSARLGSLRRNKAASPATRLRRRLYPRYRDFLKPSDRSSWKAGSSTSGRSVRSRRHRGV